MPMLIALDTDIFTEVLYGDPAMVARLAAVPIREQSLPIIVLEEVIRGRFSVIRQAESGRGRVTLEVAYLLFQQTVTDSKSYTILPYTAAADGLVAAWRKPRIRVPTHDLRIAAICIVHGAALVTRNARDFSKVPGLTIDVWR
jgi:tRNA(fMet)-specific endonuclease VapC